MVILQFNLLLQRLLFPEEQCLNTSAECSRQPLNAYVYPCGPAQSAHKSHQQARSESTRGSQTPGRGKTSPRSDGSKRGWEWGHGTKCSELEDKIKRKQLESNKRRALRGCLEYCPAGEARCQRPAEVPRWACVLGEGGAGGGGMET